MRLIWQVSSSGGSSGIDLLVASLVRLATIGPSANEPEVTWALALEMLVGLLQVALSPPLPRCPLRDSC